MPDSLDIPALARTLNGITQLYLEWSKPLDEFIEERFSSGRLEQLESEITAFQSKMCAEYDVWKEIDPVLDELFSTYLVATAKERAEIRRIVSKQSRLSDLIRNYAFNLANKIESPHDVERLRSALAAISIENCGTDSRDTMIALAELFVRAEEVGISPMPHFRTVADLSCTQIPNGGTTPVSEMLRGFDRYAVVAARRQQEKPVN